MNIGRIVREGLIAGLVGAGAVAVWFLLVDVIAGDPFFTPAMLGSAVFMGVRDPAAVTVAVEPVASYTLLHAVLFVLAGTFAASLAALVEKFPTTLFLVVVFFAVFEVGFYIAVAVLAQPLLGALAWWSVAIGTLGAALGMGFYLWQAHPQIREDLRTHPLGETMDGE